jgi:hypothetical protein
MKSKRMIAGVVVLILFVVFYYFYGGSSAPAGQHPLVRLNSSNLGALKDAFNDSAHSVRVLVLLSPT